MLDSFADHSTAVMSRVGSTPRPPNDQTRCKQPRDQHQPRIPESGPLPTCQFCGLEPGHLRRVGVRYVQRCRVAGRGGGGRAAAPPCLRERHPGRGAAASPYTRDTRPPPITCRGGARARGSASWCRVAPRGCDGNGSQQDEWRSRPVRPQDLVLPWLIS